MVRKTTFIKIRYLTLGRTERNERNAGKRKDATFLRYLRYLMEVVLSVGKPDCASTCGKPREPF